MIGRKDRDWQAYKREWLTLQWRSLVEFAKAKSLPIEAVKKAAMRDKWTEERTHVEQMANEKVKEGTAESLAQRIKRVKEENFRAATTIMGAGLRKATSKGANSAEQAVKIGMEGRLQSLDQPTEIVKMDFELTDEDRAQGTAIGLKLARLRKKDRSA